MFFGNQNMNVDLTGLLSYYKFIDNVEDSFGQNHLEVTMPPFYKDGIIDKTFVRNNHSTKLRLQNTTSMMFKNDLGDVPFSLVFFYRGNHYQWGTTTHKTLVSRVLNSLVKQIEIGYKIETSSVVLPYMYLWENESDYLYVLGEDIYSVQEPDKYFGLSFTYDGSGSASGFKIYFQGKPQVITNHSMGNYNGMTLIDVKTHLMCSSYVTQNATPLDMEEIQVWDRVLSPHEILRVYKNQTKGKPLI